MSRPEIQVWPGVVLLQGSALRAAFDAVKIGIRSRRLSGLPESRLYLELAEALAHASANGHMDVGETVAVQSVPTVEVNEAAQQLGLSGRQVRRLALKLGGRRINGRWLLDQQAIDEHREGRQWTDGN
ncbi:hypothetical protein AU197_14480 [Mycobacterium sp. IS-1590]|uniref:hypothetical protein n=1 Tax=Mycobacterium sp. IS-1590 TaxID=1772286 RepID=UPI000746D370|nr:hypothetical protein [Mycobacterium sp. IS-1590]KUI42317.1 hypothetical protein AU197_14480 [Mycobacterium sp. IS-1590]